jgi:cell division cycle 2-like
MEFHPHDLKTLLSDMSEPFLPSETKTLMQQLLSATAYLHSSWILHRDLKTSNLLLNNHGQLRLADFGMARYTSSPPPANLTQLCVTLWYRAPELLLGIASYSSAIDIWSVGCIFAELLTRDPLFQGKNEVDQLSKIFALLGAPTTESWPGLRSLPNAKALHPLLSPTSNPPRTSLPANHFPHLTAAGLSLLAGLLSLNPASRPTAASVLTHAYFREEPRAKPRAMFPTFPSRAGLERRPRRDTPQAPARGEAPRMGADDLASVFMGGGPEAADERIKGAGFSLRLG